MVTYAHLPLSFYVICTDIWAIRFHSPSGTGHPTFSVQNQPPTLGGNNNTNVTLRDSTQTQRWFSTVDPRWIRRPSSPKKRPWSSTACWNSNGHPSWVARWHGNGSFDAWRSWASLRSRTGWLDGRSDGGNWMGIWGASFRYIYFFFKDLDMFFLLMILMHWSNYITLEKL